MSDTLPPLPEPAQEAQSSGYMPGCPTEIPATPDYYNAAQMRDYARAAIAAAQPDPVALEKWRRRLWELIDAYRERQDFPISCRDRIKRHIQLMPPPAAAQAEQAADAARWVPVSDGLPAEHVPCAVRMEGDYIAIAWAAYWHGASTSFAKWVFPHESDEECADKITHWAPLPALAQQEPKA